MSIPFESSSSLSIGAMMRLLLVVIVLVPVVQVSHAGTRITDRSAANEPFLERAILMRQMKSELIKGVGLDLIFRGVRCVEVWRGLYARTTTCTDEDLAAIRVGVVGSNRSNTDEEMRRSKYMNNRLNFFADLIHHDAKSQNKYKHVLHALNELPVERGTVEGGELVLSIDSASLAKTLGWTRENLGKNGISIYVTGPFGVSKERTQGGSTRFSSLKDYRTFLERPGSWVSETKP